MKPQSAISISALLLLAGQAVGDIGDFDFPDGAQQHAVPAADMPWQPCPADLPKGCEMAVLEGNPQAAGLFTARFRLDAGLEVPPHTHPKDERVTLLSGRMSVAFGAKATHDDAHRFGPGDYYVNARDAVHKVWVDEKAELQITGFGPWQVNVVVQDSGQP